MSASQETEAAQPEAIQLVLSLNEPTKGGEFHGAPETPRGLNLDVSQEATKPTVSARISYAEEPALLVQSL